MSSVILFSLEFIKICDFHCFIGDNNTNKICDVNVNSTTVISLHEKKSKTGYDFLITRAIIKQLNIKKCIVSVFYIRS